MEDYEKLLNEAYSKVKTINTGTGDRFEIPKAEGRFEGKKTIITNFTQIASYLRRPIEHFQKFILKELATSGTKEGDRFILNQKFPSDKLNIKIEQYAKAFVICKECGKPDTEIRKDGRMHFLHCLACGAKQPINSKI